jgi:predicted TIM-barrel fold metal-dependent hydrolase
MRIDCHQHVNWLGKTINDSIKYFDEVGVDKACVLSWESIDGSLEPWYSHLSIDHVREVWHKYPDRIIPFAAPDPRRDNVESMLRDLVKEGFVGYGELKVRICFDNPDAVRVYRLCGELGLPVLFHFQEVTTQEPKLWYMSDIDSVDRVLSLCPDTNFIGHGPGFWSEISGKVTNDLYPKGPVQPGGSTIRLLEQHDNLYADISAGSGLNALSRSQEFGKQFINDFANRILYGTDNFNREHLDFLELLELDEDVKKKIFSENILKLMPLYKQ